MRFIRIVSKMWDEEHAGLYVVLASAVTLVACFVAPKLLPEVSFSDRTHPPMTYGKPSE